jgi:hypothetical protein
VRALLPAPAGGLADAGGGSRGPRAQGGFHEPLLPLSVGLETVPVGQAYVFFSVMPDLFVVNNKLSTEPGLYLYEWLHESTGGVPVFRRRVQVTHPFKGLLPPTGTIMQVRSCTPLQLTSLPVRRPRVLPQKLPARSYSHWG